MKSKKKESKAGIAKTVFLLTVAPVMIPLFCFGIIIGILVISLAAGYEVGYDRLWDRK